MKKRRKFSSKKIKKLHRKHRKVKKLKPKFSLIFNFGKGEVKHSDIKKLEKKLKIDKKQLPEKKREVQFPKFFGEKKQKPKINIGRILFEFLFWFGLAVVIVTFLFRLQFYYNIVGLIFMIGSLIQYFIVNRKQVKIKEEILLETPKKKIVEKKVSKEEIKDKDAKKKIAKRINTIAFLILLFTGFIILIQKFDLLGSIYGISVLVIIAFVIFLVLIQSRRQVKIKKEKGIVSKPNIEIEKALKELKTPETEIDLLLRYINIKKRVSISTAAKDFGLTHEKIEEWVKILESHNLIRIFYPAFGDPSLVSVDQEKKEENGS